jgi:ElaA protein
MKSILTCQEFSRLSVVDLYCILRLRSQVFVLEQQCLYQDLDNQDQESMHMCLRHENGELMAYLRILPKTMQRERVSIGRVVVHPDYRQWGLGHELVSHALAWIENAWGQVDILIGAQSYLIDFYQSMGFVLVSERYLEDGIEHVDMLRQ